MDTSTSAAVSNLPRSGIGVLVLAASTSAALGATVTYFITRKHLEKKYKEIAIREIADARMYYSRLYKADFETPGDAVEALIGPAADAMEQYQGRAAVDDSGDPIPEPQGPIKRNIFLNGEALKESTDFDYEHEVTLRTPDQPYVVLHDEFMENDPDYHQPSLTYYEGDDILADEKDEPIEDVEGTVGVANLQRFGHGSKDTKVVYVRNERLALDFEITRSPGKYTEEVLGFRDPDVRAPRPHRRDGE